jgi:hypothetical protein
MGTTESSLISLGMNGDGNAYVKPAFNEDKQTEKIIII